MTDPTPPIPPHLPNIAPHITPSQKRVGGAHGAKPSVFAPRGDVKGQRPWRDWEVSAIFWFDGVDS